MVPVDFCKSKITRYVRSGDSDPLQFHGNARKLGIDHGRVLMVSERLVDFIDLLLQHGKNVHCFLWLAGPSISKRVKRAQEAVGLVLGVFPIAYGVASAVKVSREPVDLTVRQTQLVSELELVLRRGDLLSIREGQSNSVANEAVFRILKRFIGGSVSLKRS